MPMNYEKPKPHLAVQALFAAVVAALSTAAALAQSPEFIERPGLFDPGNRPLMLPIGDRKVDNAVQCLADTRVLRFLANPAVVQPFANTTFSWEVVFPAGCNIALSIAGRRVESVGTLDVTPLHATNSFGLMGSMLGVTGTLASTGVSVDQSSCREQVLSEVFIAPQIEAAINAFDEQNDDFKQTERPLIQVEANALSIHIVVKAEVTAFPDATVTLDIGLRFTVRDGVIEPRYTLFRPKADTALPDDFVESNFFDRSDSILADFKRGFNEAIKEIVSDEERLFDLTTEPFALRATKCRVEPPPAPQLTIQLKVIPSSDPGRFNLRIDGVTHAGNQADGGSTGAQEVSAGVHTVSQRPVAPTDLANYQTFISGDCSPDGRVTLTAGDAKICVITNVAQSNPGQCKEDCRKERDLCRKDPESTPAICAALFKACMASCN